MKAIHWVMCEYNCDLRLAIVAVRYANELYFYSDTFKDRTDFYFKKGKYNQTINHG